MSELKVNTISPYNSNNIAITTPGGYLIVNGDLSTSGNLLVGNYSMIGAPQTAATSKYYVDQQFNLRGLSGGLSGASTIYVDQQVAAGINSIEPRYIKVNSITGQTHLTSGITFSGGPYEFGSFGAGGGLVLNVNNTENTVGIGATAPYSGSSVKLHLKGQLGFGYDTNPMTTSRIHQASGNILTVNGYNRTILQVAGASKLDIQPNIITFGATSTNLDIVGTLTGSHNVRFTGATDSTSTTTGVLTVAGGAGIAKNLYVGGTVYVPTTTAAPGSAMSVSGGVAVGGQLGVTGNVFLDGLVTMNSTNTQSLTLNGGAVVSGDLVIGGGVTSAGVLRFTNPTDSTSTTTGAIIVSGGLGVAKGLFAGGATFTNIVRFSNAVASVSTTTGNLIVAGGVGIAGALNVGGGISGSGAIPIGGIIIWYGSVANIPYGWALCNGQTIGGHTTPDLRDRFVVGAGSGAGSSYAVGASGGAATHTLTLAETPTHTHYGRYSFRGTDNQTESWGHSAVVGFAGNQDNVYTVTSQTEWQNTASSQNSTYPLGSVGSGYAHNNLPPYYALCYIMRYI